ncbi:hypothetical protein EST38_g11792 [Candolleomyces aberdarensis]|uniref:Uncharacterized protein n=1 Tax=Candolleomyces aberdarensis TaxID=2316362 RepID=A0A4Q2D5J0_9AGAR|nr:hypothetical protein EST38_g11792 [Candolleomyces aberdarensis]
MSSPSTNSYVDAARRALKPNDGPTGSPKQSTPRRGTRSAPAPVAGRTPPAGGTTSPVRVQASSSSHASTPATPPARTFTFGLPTPSSMPSGSPSFGSSPGKARKADGTPSSNLHHTASSGAARAVLNSAPNSRPGPQTGSQKPKKPPVDRQAALPASAPATPRGPSKPPTTTLKEAGAKEQTFGAQIDLQGRRKRVVATTLTFGSIQASRDGEFGSSESEVDHGAQLDRSDPPYRGPSVKNRASSPPIIKTRRARAAEQKMLAEGKTSASQSEKPPLSPSTPASVNRNTPSSKTTATPTPIQGAHEGRRGRKRGADRSVDFDSYTAETEMSAALPLAPSPTIVSTRKRQKRSRAVLSSEDDSGSPSFEHSFFDPMSVDHSVQQNVADELFGPDEDGDVASDDTGSIRMTAHNEKHYYDGKDMDEYEASFIDDNADDVGIDEVLEYDNSDAGSFYVGDDPHFDLQSNHENVGDPENEVDGDHNMGHRGNGTPPAHEQDGALRSPADYASDGGAMDDGEVDKEHETTSLPAGTDTNDGDPVPASSEVPNTRINLTRERVPLADEGVLTFGAVVGFQNDDNGSFSRYQDDLEYTMFRGTIKLDGTVVEVLQDPLLKQYYKDGKLEKYQKGCFLTWSKAEVKEGMAEFSTWGHKCPKLRFKSCISSINFRRLGSFVNLARVGLRELSVRNVNGTGQNFHLCTADRRVATCLSPIEVRESFLYTPPKRGLRKKGISGILHTQEYERTAGCTCTAFDDPELHAQLFQNMIRFETKAEFSKAKSDKNASVASPSVKVSTSAKAGTPKKTLDQISLDYDTESE